MSRPRLPGTVSEILGGSKGPEIGAFFDMDGTLIAGFSARYLAQDRLRNRDLGASELIKSLSVIASEGVNHTSFGNLMTVNAQAWRGRALDQLEERADRIFEKEIRGLIFPEMREIVQAHRSMGHTVVLSSSASSFQAEPVASYLGIEHVLCNRFAVKDGTLTGEIQQPVLWGPGKSDAVQRFATQHDVDLKLSYFYADGDEDTPLMHLVGHPRPTNPGKGLSRVAAKRGWPILRFTSRGATPERTVRAAVGMGAGLPLIGLGVAYGLARRDKRAGINFVFEHWLEFMLDACNVKLNVVGEEHAWSQRPAVFLVNHRTTFDGIIAMSILRKDFTAVAKAEIGKNPVGGAIGRLLDIAWVERENTEAAVAALQPIEDLARSGLSVLIAPEGTRSEEEGIGPFKKGAFRIAMAAKLPIVPIVVRNAEVIGGRNAFAMHPGTVDVAIREPIQTDDWTLDNLPEHIERVRQLYVDTLSDWPG